MKNIAIYEPAMCCSTGLCGVGVDPELLRISTVSNNLKKAGVGKTTIAAAIALGLAERGRKVHLTTTDPAAHLRFIMNEGSGITMSRIDEKAENQVVVIDTAPTGHTLLLLDSTQSYNQEIKRSQGNIPESARKLLPRLRKAEETEVIIVTLAEATPVYEAMRLEEDLKRAGISAKWWIINSSLYQSHTTNQMLSSKAGNEIEWINKVDEHTNGKFAVIAWSPDEIKGDKLREL